MSPDKKANERTEKDQRLDAMSEVAQAHNAHNTTTVQISIPAQGTYSVKISKLTAPSPD